MIDNQIAVTALRNRAITLAGPTTGSTTLTATTTGYSRASGSFLEDGFVVGMEITPSGFTSNPVSCVTAVAALTLTVRDARSAEASASGRTLAVLFPALRAFENIDFTPTSGRWYAEDDYLPGPAIQETLGPLGWIETLPQYVVKFYGLQNTSTAALFKVADAFLALFPPRQNIVLSDGNVIVVRTNPAPYRGQIQAAPDAGWAVVAVTVPCRVRSQNTI